MVATLLTNAAESNRGVLRWINETSWGTTPGTGVVHTMRITSSSLEAKKTTKVSEEIRADRMIPNIIEVAAMTDGDVGFEFSAGGQDDFYEQFLLANFSRSMNHLMVKGSTVSVVTTSKIRLAGQDMSGWLANNQYVKLEGFNSPFNNGYFKVSSFAFTGGNTDITTVETSLVVEVGGPYSKLMDANDVLMKSTTAVISAGNKITLTGWTTGLGLKAGQKLWLEGLGKETGSIAFNGIPPANNDTFSISDGTNPAVTFEFATSAALASTGHIFVLVSPLDPSATADALNVAIMDQFKKHNFAVSSLKTAGVKQTGSFAFSGVATAADAVTVDDGVHALRTFTFVASGAVLGSGNVNVGVTAADSGTNLAAEINAQTAAGTLNVLAAGTSTVTVTNHYYSGGTLAETVDSGLVITTTNFGVGTKPILALTNGYQSGAITESLASMTATAFSGGSASKNGFVTIAAVTDANNVEVVETLTADANAGVLTVIVKGSHLRNPGDPTLIVKKSISAETGFTDVGKYLGHNGLRLSTFSQTVAPGDIVKGKLAFMGRETRALDATELGNVSNYTVLDTTIDEIFNGTSNVDNISRNGVALTTAILKIDINGDAGLRSQPAVGAKFPAGIGYGRFSLKGTFTAYFQNFDLYRDFLNHNTSSLAWDVHDIDWNKYFFTIPSIKYTASPLSLDGIDKDVTSQISWQAQRDATLATMFMIDRFSSIWPVTVA
jgi:hypothetical protein